MESGLHEIWLGACSGAPGSLFWTYTLTLPALVSSTYCVATQYVLETKAGNVSVYVQNSEPGAQEQAPSEISWSADSTFVVDSTEGAQ